MGEALNGVRPVPPISKQPLEDIEERQASLLEMLAVEPGGQSQAG